jgi:hypothetical protein
MGMLKQMMDVKEMINAAPGMVAHEAAVAGSDFEPIEGVSLEQFAAVSKSVAAYNYDPSMPPQLAASRGIASHAWDAAAQGWNEPIRRNRAVAQRFNQMYRGI